MTTEKIEEGVRYLGEQSIQVKSFIDNPDSLFDYLNTLNNDQRLILYDYYKDKSGVVINIRREIATILNDRDVGKEE